CGSCFLRSSPAWARLDIEQPENLLLIQAHLRRRTVLLDQLIEQLPFALEHLSDAAFQGVLRDEACDENGFLLANAVRAVDGLVFDSGVPPAVEEENVVRKLQIQADAAGAVTHEEDVLGCLALERIQDGLALTVGYAAVVLKRANIGERLGDELQRLDPLRKDDGLATALGYFGKVGLQALQLGAFAGGGVEVANLFQAHHQLENVLHRDRVP